MAGLGRQCPIADTGPRRTPTVGSFPVNRFSQGPREVSLRPRKVHRTPVSWHSLEAHSCSPWPAPLPPRPGWRSTPSSESGSCWPCTSSACRWGCSTRSSPDSPSIRWTTTWGAPTPSSCVRPCCCWPAVPRRAPGCGSPLACAPPGTGPWRAACCCPPPSSAGSTCSGRRSSRPCLDGSGRCTPRRCRGSGSGSPWPPAPRPWRRSFCGPRGAGAGTWCSSSSGGPASTTGWRSWRAAAWTSFGAGSPTPGTASSPAPPSSSRACGGC